MAVKAGFVRPQQTGEVKRTPAGQGMNVDPEPDPR
jgi:hypothetical protein